MDFAFAREPCGDLEDVEAATWEQGDAEKLRSIAGLGAGEVDDGFAADDGGSLGRGGRGRAWRLPVAADNGEEDDGCDTEESATHAAFLVEKMGFIKREQFTLGVRRRDKG